MSKKFLFVSAAILWFSAALYAEGNYRFEINGNVALNGYGKCEQNHALSLSGIFYFQTVTAD